MHNWISPQNVYVRLDYFKPAGIDRGACILRAPMKPGAAGDLFAGEVPQSVWELAPITNSVRR